MYRAIFFVSLIVVYVQCVHNSNWFNFLLPENASLDEIRLFDDMLSKNFNDTKYDPSPPLFDLQSYDAPPTFTAMTMNSTQTSLQFMQQESAFDPFNYEPQLEDQEDLTQELMVALAAQMHKSEPIFNDIFQSQKYSNEFSENFPEMSIEDYKQIDQKKDKPTIIAIKKNIDWMPDIKTLPKGFPRSCPICKTCTEKFMIKCQHNVWHVDCLKSKKSNKFLRDSCCDESALERIKSIVVLPVKKVKNKRVLY